MRAVLAIPVLLFTLAAPVAAQTATLVRDINTGPADLTPSLFSPGAGLSIPVGDRFFFDGRTTPSGVDLWVSDGTAPGTHPVTDLCSGFCFAPPEPAGVLGNVLLFDPGAGAERLWRTDGTPAGTFALPAGASSARVAAALGGTLVFTTCPALPTGCELWATDATVAGTRRLATIGGQVYFITTAGPRVFAVVQNRTSGGFTLWTSDGTAAGTHVAGSLPNDIRALLPAGDRVVLWNSFGSQSELWGSDGTAAGTGLLERFGPDPGDAQSIVLALPLNGKVYFEADDGTHGIQVWTSDGTAAGTARVSDLHGFTPDLFYEEAVRLGDRLLFPASDAAGHSRLFATDGPPESTRQVSPVNVESTSFALRDGRALFLADDGVHGREPWASDGTPAGTVLVKDVCPGPCGVSGSGEAPFRPLLGAAFFLVGDPQQGADLWVTDGTAAGTRRYTDFGTTPRPVLDYPIAGAGGKIFFSAHDPVHGKELWVSDGRRGGTRRLTEAAREPSSDPGELTALGDRLLFTACDGVTSAVWTTTGMTGALASTAATTDRSAASPCGSAAAPHGLTAAAGAVYFLAGPADGLVLWRTDGTPTGASRVFTFPGPLGHPPVLAGSPDGLWWSVESAAGVQLWRAGATGPQPIFSLPPGIVDLSELTVLGQEVFYLGNEGGAYDVFVTGSTGTRQIGGPIVPPGDRRGPAPQFRLLGGRALFVTAADAPTVALTVWATDGTPAGTVPLHRLDDNSTAPRLATLGGAVYFLESPADRPATLWRTDGTPAGTVAITTLAAHTATQLTTASGRLFFTAADDAHGTELWASDGTGSGTGLVRDLLPGLDGSQPENLTDGGASGRLFFTADDGTHGAELWESDGTAAGTRLVQDLAPAASSSSPISLTVAGDRLYFSADDGLSGRELWSLPLAGPSGCVPGDTRLCLAGGRFQVEIAWQDFGGRTGVGHTIPLTADTGAFWFFDPANVEVIVKVLDARGLNDAFWVFYGALSNVQYSLTVTDTATGLTRRYDNPAGQLASVGDTNGFGPQGASAPTATPKTARATPLVSARTDARAATGVCAPGPTRLCLQGGRFAVTAVWKDFQGRTGTGTAVPLSGDTGYFWFFAPTNVEVVAKVLDGRALGGKFWFFYGALSNVEYTLTVTDTQTGAVKIYKNPSGQFGSVADTAAF